MRTHLHGLSLRPLDQLAARTLSRGKIGPPGGASPLPAPPTPQKDGPSLIKKRPSPQSPRHGKRFARRPTAIGWRVGIISMAGLLRSKGIILLTFQKVRSRGSTRETVESPGSAPPQNQSASRARHRCVTFAALRAVIPTGTGWHVLPMSARPVVPQPRSAPGLFWCTATPQVDSFGRLSKTSIRHRSRQDRLRPMPVGGDPGQTYPDGLVGTATRRDRSSHGCALASIMPSIASSVERDATSTSGVLSVMYNRTPRSGIGAKSARVTRLLRRKASLTNTSTSPPAGQNRHDIK